MKTFTRGILTILIVLFAFATLQADDLEKGIRYYNKSDLKKAEDSFLRHIYQNKISTVAHYHLALIFSNNSFSGMDLDKASIYIKRAVDSYRLNDKDDIKNCRKYKVTYDQILKIQERIEQSLYLKMQSKGNIAEFEEFIANTEQTQFVDKAVLQRNRIAFNEVKSRGTEEAFISFINKYPDAREVKEAIQLRNAAAFKKAMIENTPRGFDAFISKYPDAAEVEEAKRIRNDISYIAYLEKDKQLQEITLAKQDAELAQKEAEIERQKSNMAREKESFQNLLIVACLLLVLIVVAIIAYLGKRRANNQISQQKVIIEEKNKEIIDSINYAKTIQDAILPPLPIITKHFPDCFVLYKPKDIVSGDFYWFAEIDGKKILAAVDCTGHGVPGGFMSMIGNTLLNQIVKVDRITDAAEVLNHLRDKLIHYLLQNNEQTNDGMDMAIIVVKDMDLQFAGAFNRLIVIHQNGELDEYKGCRQPIGRHFKYENIPFKSHDVKLRKGDNLYLFSDGYADQFGGTDNRRFSIRQFRSILQTLHSKPMREQQDQLETIMKDWMGNESQMDDMMVVGVKV